MNYGDPWCANHYNNQVIVEMDKMYCMTFDEKDNLLYIGSCPYNSLLLILLMNNIMAKNSTLFIYPKMPLSLTTLMQCQQFYPSCQLHT